MSAVAAALRRWWFTPMPLARVAVFRALVYLFVPLDIFVTRAMGSFHGNAAGLYKPLMLGRALHLPVPTHDVVTFVKWGCIVAALVAATGRLPRLAGWVAFLLYFEWLIIGFSFGKVDHDRYAYLVALAVMPTVGRARFRDRTPSEAAGWALRCVQVGVVLTYFLASWAKIRYGGLAWVNSATLVRAVLRRGTPWTKVLLDHPEILHLSQWGIMTMEILSPVILFVPPRWQYAGVGLLAGFHLTTYAAITIIFLPHVVCLASFLPLERLIRPSRPRPVQASRAAPDRLRRRRSPAPTGSAG